MLLLLGILLLTIHPSAQKASVPTATLRPASSLRLPGGVDSNSPVVWDRRAGRSEVYVTTSINGQPTRTEGDDVTTLANPVGVSIDPWPGGGVWMEAIVTDRTGAWYGFYHNENSASVCGRADRTYARIGAARSEDYGATWTNLGIVLDMPPGTFACGTSNRYFVGGSGDLSVLLDRASRDLFIYFSQYGRDVRQQGVAVARLAWADRDAPIGKLTVWSSGVWLPATLHEADETEPRWVYPPATPLVTPRKPWHDADRAADAFWGPSIHWNASLRQYVMLLNRASDENFSQEGIYVSFSPRLDDPLAWSPPRKILNGGAWYPQVVGIEPGRGTDRWAGQLARFYMSGRSDYVIEFTP